MDLKETDILGDSINRHWYYRSKASAMERLLSALRPRTILDVGAGSGFFARHLLKNTSAENAWCIDISYDQESDVLEGAKQMYFRHGIDSLDADLVLLMDVLEHVDDDVGLLSSYVNKVPRGAYFLISVPAFQFMWSEHDIFLQHKRRYQLKQIEEVARHSGLGVATGVYYFGAVLPLAIVSRLAPPSYIHGERTPRSQLSNHSPLVNHVLTAICAAELPIMSFNRVAGLTAFCLAKKL